MNRIRSQLGSVPDDELFTRVTRELLITLILAMESIQQQAYTLVRKPRELANLITALTELYKELSLAHRQLSRHRTARETNDAPVSTSSKTLN
jgi:hypothetical protein